MISDKELYGTENVPPVPKEIADKRIDLLMDNLERELAKPFDEQDPFIEYEIMKAIRFWRKLSKQEAVGL